MNPVPTPAGTATPLTAPNRPCTVWLLVIWTTAGRTRLLISATESAWPGAVAGALVALVVALGAGIAVAAPSGTVGNGTAVAVGGDTVIGWGAGPVVGAGVVGDAEPIEHAASESASRSPARANSRRARNRIRCANVATLPGKRRPSCSHGN